MLIDFELGGRRMRADSAAALDISIPLRFDAQQPTVFGASAASAVPLRVGGFVGDTRAGGSCNAQVCTVTPHCNGTHTEGIGHLVDERLSVGETGIDPLVPALLVSAPSTPAQGCAETCHPEASGNEQVVTRTTLEACLAGQPCLSALVLRTLPNPPDKRTQRYAGECPAPYFTEEAMHLLVERAVQHLLVDLPSLDRAHDGGGLRAHRIFWGLPAGSRRLQDASRADATVTELVYVPDRVADGQYLLALQIAPFASDAAPSRPLLYALEAV